MKKFFLFFLIFCFFVYRSVSAEDWLNVLETKEIAAVTEDVSLLNLLNGIYLTADQVEELIALAAEVQKTRDAFVARNQKLQDQYLLVLKEFKTVLQANEGFSAGEQKKVQDIEQQLKMQQQGFYADIKDFDRRLNDILDDSQKYIIQRFQPCIIPPQELSNPIRAGQAGSDLSAIENILLLINRLPPKAYESFVEDFVDNLLFDREVHFGVMAPEEKEQERKRLLSVAEEARRMTEEDVLIHKTRLAKQMVHYYEEISRKFNDFLELNSAMHGGLSRAGQYLLNPRVLPLLEAHLQSLTKQGGKRRREEYVPKKKPTMQNLALQLEMEQRQKLPVWDVIYSGKVRMWDLLQKPRKDHRNMIQEIQDLESSDLQDIKKMQKFLELLSLSVPGGRTTYLEEINKIKKDVERKLSDILTKEQMVRLKILKIDILDIEK